MARSKEFNEEEALDKAMEIFWKQGYEKTSVQDLVDQMGIHRRSLYDTFGDKHSLFVQTLERYESLITSQIKKQITEDMTTVESIRKIFELAIYSDNTYPKGCLLVNTAVELSLLDDEVSQRIKAAFKQTEKLIADLLRKGQAKGEVASSFDISELSRYIHNALIGVRVSVKMAANQKELDATIDMTLSILKNDQSKQS
ncbi:transcription regulator ysia c-terminal [Trichococcus palustris]|jgi:TetR/AcrR family transcriptional regulator, transcriptional repressor for nem operon|uniref:Transcription regulator ysia c-terminal n=1 Tax=Trichococcus palustris TaxID=140314 RepID=A0A143YS41_9LACT|nr:TetR/AcrR family transcriptional regulator [Trichococcus palustris]CZQ95618.1 transcription regulator ysia c-terminal [Trichococcus palustris]SFK97027.1 transcriptional regulator, TetR family [Trichococcus palustris]